MRGLFQLFVDSGAENPVRPQAHRPVKSGVKAALAKSPTMRKPSPMGALQFGRTAGQALKLAQRARPCQAWLPKFLSAGDKRGAAA
jgi:hypothetical protein